MINLRSNKGITLMAEVLTVILLVMVITAVTYSSNSALQIRNLNKMYSDITTLQEKAASYYLENGTAPVTTDQIDITSITSDVNPNDSSDGYYKIDTTKLSNLTLNYEQTATAFYFINTQSLTVYYTKGVSVSTSGDSVTYYTMPSNYETTTTITLETYQ